MGEGSFFAAPPKASVPQPFLPVAGASGRGQRWLPIDRAADEQARCDRIRAETEAHDAAVAALGQVVVDGVVLDARSRPVGVITTATRNNREGLQSTALCEGRKPRGMLFHLGPGFFDLDGFWCVPNNKGEVAVYRGASKGQRRHLTATQQKLLTAAQMKGRRSGLR